MPSFALPSSPDDRAKIMSAIREISASMTRMEGEKDYISESVKELSKKYEIPGKHLNKFARAYHKSQFSELKTTFQDFEDLCDALIPDQG